MRRALSGMLAVVVVATSSAAAPGWAADDPEADIRFLSYNVKNNYYRDADGDRLPYAPSSARYWEHREDGVVDLIARANTQVVALQETEAYTDEDGDTQYPALRVRDALRARGEPYELATAKDSPRAVLYDASVLDAGGTGAVSAPEYGTHPARWVTLTDLERDVPFHVANMHLSVRADGHDSTDPESEAQRTAEAEAVVATMRDVAGDERVVYIGDYNTYPGRDVEGADGAGDHLWDSGAIETGDTREGWRTCYRHCTNFAYDTYNDFGDPEDHMNSRHVDRMFVSDAWRDTLEWKLVFVAQGVSDHYPIKVWMTY